jgi:hypothetical protein
MKLPNLTTGGERKEPYRGEVQRLADEGVRPQVGCTCQRPPQGGFCYPTYNYCGNFGRPVCQEFNLGGCGCTCQ